MVGQLGTAELASVSLGSSFVFIAMSLGIGFSTALTPLVAQADGRSDTKRVAQNHDWFVKQCESYDVNIRFMSNLSIIAIQGPQSLNLLKKIGINDLHDMSDFDIAILYYPIILLESSSLHP